MIVYLQYIHGLSFKYVYINTANSVCIPSSLRRPCSRANRLFRRSVEKKIVRCFSALHTFSHTFYPHTSCMYCTAVPVANWSQSAHGVSLSTTRLPSHQRYFGVNTQKRVICGGHDECGRRDCATYQKRVLQ